MKRILILNILLLISFRAFSQDLNLEFVVKTELEQNHSIPENGRLFLVFNYQEPNDITNGIQYPDLEMAPIFGIDVTNWNGQTELHLDSGFYGFPIKDISNLKAGKWFVYGLYDRQNHSPYINEPGNYYSDPLEIEIKKTSQKQTFSITLNNKIEQTVLPSDKKHFKHVKFRSTLLSNFAGQPVYLRSQVILPKSYYTDPAKKYPIVFYIGGFGFRYHNSVISEASLFSDDMPQMIIVALDSKAPFGDSYQVNSENNGPYGDAIVNEFIPYLEKKFRGVGEPYSRFLTGTSTGGWSSLALQIFYPDYFNGAWSTCSDPVDFRQMELINIYDDENVFVNEFGVERPAMRNTDGEPRYTVRIEIQAENTLGSGNSYILSGAQWASWNAVYSPRDTVSGFPMAIFDPQTGDINKDIAKAWEKYDLRLYLSRNWKTIGEKLQGKLHIWMGTADNYYLNNAMVLFDNFINGTEDPKSDAEMHFIYGEGHACNYLLPTKEIMKKMLVRMEQTKNN